MKKTQERAVTDLTRGVIWRQILVFALPFLLSNLLQQFYSTADAAIVGILDQLEELESYVHQ